jgi:hypothetical protein
MNPTLGYQEIMEHLKSEFQYQIENQSIRLFGILFAPPSTTIGRDHLLPGLNDFHARSGDHIDFFCVGYGPNLREDIYPGREYVGKVAGIEWYYIAKKFNETRENLEKMTRWRFSGEADLILALARFNRESESVFLDFSKCLMFDLDLMLKDDPRLSVRRLFEVLFRLAENVGNEEELSKYLDHENAKRIGKAGVASLIDYLPKGIGTFYNQAWVQGRHYQFEDLQSK